MFMQWILKHLPPVFMSSYLGKMILCLNNASYHHDFDKEEKSPKANSKRCNTDLHYSYTRSKQSNLGREERPQRWSANCGDLSEGNPRCGTRLSKRGGCPWTRTIPRSHCPDKLL
ncbi:unnamed protein product [Choristocarpus tenellus]